MHSFEWINVASVAEALAQTDNVTVADATVTPAKNEGNGQRGKGAGAVIKAGGLDLLDLLKECLVAPARVVNIREVPGLGEITAETKNGLRLGPLVTLAQVGEHSTVRRDYTALADAASHSATPQVRNVATLGGNLLQRPRCWYFRAEHFRCLKKGGETCFAIPGENQYHAVFDNERCAIVHASTSATALVALGAPLDLTGSGGKTREVELEEFFVRPEKDVTRENSLRAEELVTEVRIPALPAGTRSLHFKQGEKESFDWPIAEVAAVLTMEGNAAARRPSCSAQRRLCLGAPDVRKKHFRGRSWAKRSPAPLLKRRWKAPSP